MDQNIGPFAIFIYEIVGFLKVLTQIELFIVVGRNVLVVFDDGLVILEESTSGCTNYGFDVLLYFKKGNTLEDG